MPPIISESVKRFVEEYSASFTEKEGAVSPEAEGLIHVSHITRGLGFFYEKIRNTLDYKEESLWAKNAILRILMRREMQFLSAEPLGLLMIRELIRGRYLENDAIPAATADTVDEILGKYRMLWERVFTPSLVRQKNDRKLANWVMMLAACELEEVLRKSDRDALAIDFLYHAMRDRIEYPEKLDGKEWRLQTYLASYRAMVQADEDLESWTLFKLSFPEWRQNPDQQVIERIAKELPDLKARIDKALRWQWRRELDRIFKHWSLLVTLLRDILEAEPLSGESLLSEPEKLEASLRLAYDKRYQENRRRLRRSAWRAVFFIFFTKMLFALGVEAPYEVWATGAMHYKLLGLNLLLPPFILMIASLSIRMPGEEQNFVRLLVDFNNLVSNETAPLGALRIRLRRKTFAKISIAALYILNFFITSLLIIWFVRKVGFNIVSATIFVIFLSLVSFFALRLRKTANELAAVEESEHWARQLFDFLFFPIVEVGRLLNLGLRSLNIVAFIFDYLIEAPFNSFVEMMEEWVQFLKERKEAL